MGSTAGTYGLGLRVPEPIASPRQPAVGFTRGRSPPTLRPVKNRTFVMCKPDAVERGLVGEVIGRLERKGLTLVAAELRDVDEGFAERHYAEHQGKSFYGDLVGFITRSPVFAMVVEGPDENTYLLVRKVVGATKVEDAEPGTIRGDYATITTENLVHASDGHESAAREIALWFPGLT
jgi:nucleoside-diphosphate kinase